MMTAYGGPPGPRYGHTARSALAEALYQMEASRRTGWRTVRGSGLKSPAMMRGNIACMRLMSENFVSAGDRNCGTTPRTLCHHHVCRCTPLRCAYMVLAGHRLNCCAPHECQASDELAASNRKAPRFGLTIEAAPGRRRSAARPGRRPGSRHPPAARRAAASTEPVPTVQTTQYGHGIVIPFCTVVGR